MYKYKKQPVAIAMKEEQLTETQTLKGGMDPVKSPPLLPPHGPPKIGKDNNDGNRVPNFKCGR